MKAKEMPKKIYLFDYNDAMVIPIEGDTVYVRQDAFIEKAVKWLEDNAIEYWGTEAVDNGMMIDDFKKAMREDNL